MTTGTAYREELFVATEPAERRRGLLVVTTSAYPECTCPEDCERDHENE